MGNLGQRARFGQQAAGSLRDVPDADPGSAVALVARYLRAVAAQDWATVQACLSPAVVRRGPFADDFAGRAPYLEFLRRTMPALPGYRMDLDHVTATGSGTGQAAGTAGGTRIFAELRETVVVDGEPVLTEECLVFEVGRRIEAVSIYIRRTS